MAAVAGCGVAVAGSMDVLATVAQYESQFRQADAVSAARPPAVGSTAAARGGGSGDRGGDPPSADAGVCRYSREGSERSLTG